MLAGSWKTLYVAKAAAGELCPCKWEVAAAIASIKACASDLGLAVCALIDGSGSMAAGAALPLPSPAAQVTAGCGARALRTARRRL